MTNCPDKELKITAPGKIRYYRFKEGLANRLANGFSAL
jgi:hypothetical protein